MNEQEKEEPKTIKKIVIVLIVVSVILAIYYFNKPVVISPTDENQAGENKEGEQKPENGDIKADDLVQSVEVKTSEGTDNNAMTLVNSLVAGNPVATVTLEPKQAAEKAVNYVNKYVVPQTQEAKLVEVYPEKVAFYKLIMNIADQKYPAYVSIDGKTLLSVKEYDLNKNPNVIDGREYVNIADDFQEVKGAEICKENGKPIVYFFGSDTCPHCKWEQPIVSEVVKSFGDKISYHENIDSNKDVSILEKFSSQGGIPTTIIGCKYFKVGSGENIGSVKEKSALLLLINSVLK